MYKVSKEVVLMIVLYTVQCIDLTLKMKSFAHRYQNTKWDYYVIHSTFAPRVHPHDLILTQNIASSPRDINVKQISCTKMWVGYIIAIACLH